ncbi:hypothetical protein ACE939_12395 [Aquimarina sp. W85]|uniref:hypothetical protein n=1 Tax=Aquimarina rhodophyticola TaxID=3342246 RepID=UPI00366BA5D7
MNLEELPFKLGMPYENWEFDLDFIEVTRLYDKYKYSKEDITDLCGLTVQHIYLYFNLDILFKVEVVFKCFNPVVEFIQLTTQLENKYGKQTLDSNEDLTKLHKTWQDSAYHLIIEYHLKPNYVYLILADKKYEDV